MRICAERISITAEGYKILREGEIVFAAPSHAIRYIQEEKSQADNPANAAGRGEPGQTFTPSPRATDLADANALGKSHTATEAVPKFVTLQELAKAFQTDVKLDTIREAEAIHKFINYIDARASGMITMRR